MPLFQQLGFVDEVLPTQGHYLHSLVLGATLPGFRKRLAFLRKLWERNIHFNTHYCLASRRALIEAKESFDLIYNPKNHELPFDPPTLKPTYVPGVEADMMDIVIRQAESQLPWTKHMETNLVISEHVNGRPANSEETLIDWKKLSATGGRCLIVSSQPFVMFQNIIAQKALGQKYEVDCVGYESPPLPATTFLDCLAKCIFELARMKHS